jgi:hypothetical protein
MRLYEFEHSNDSLDVVKTEHVSITALLSKVFLNVRKMEKLELVQLYKGPALVNARKKYEQHYQSLVNIFAKNLPGSTTTVPYSTIENLIPTLDRYIQTDIINTAAQTIPCQVVSFNRRKLGDDKEELDNIGASCSIRLFGRTLSCEMTINYESIYKSVNGGVVTFIQLLLSTIIHEFTHYLQYNKMFANQPISQVASFLMSKRLLHAMSDNLPKNIYLSHASMDIKLIRDLLAQYRYNAAEVEIQAWAVQVTIELLEHASSDELRKILNNRKLTASDDKLTLKDQATERPDLFKLAGYSKHFGVYLLFKAAGGHDIYDEFVDRVLEQLKLYDSGTDPMLTYTHETTWA